MYVISDPSFPLNVDAFRAFHMVMWSPKASLLVSARVLLMDHTVPVCWDI